MTNLPKYVLIFFSLFFSLNVTAQGGFKKKYYIQNSASSVCSNVIEAPNGNFIMTGFVADTIDQCNCLCIAAADHQGNFLWQKKYGNSKLAYLDNILTPRGAVYKDVNAFYYAVGIRDSNNYQFGALIKFNYQGDTLWQKFYKETLPKDVIFQGLTKSVDGGFLITGTSQGGGQRFCLLIKTDINGKELWRKLIPKPTPNVHDGKCLVQDTLTKKIIIVGYQYVGTSTYWDTYSNILIVDSLGNNPFQTTFNNADGGGFVEVIQLKDKNFISCGSWYASNGPKYNGFITKFNLNGSLIWSRKINFPATYSSVDRLYELQNGDILALARIDTMQKLLLSAVVKLQLLRFDKNGVLLSTKYLGSSYDEQTSEISSSMAPTTDHGLIISSRFFLMSSTKPYSIIKIDSIGCDTVDHYCKSLILDISEQSKIQGYQFEIFPNPANEFVTINIDADANKEFVLKICDVSGKEIEKEILESNSKIQINTSSFKEGIYFLNIFYEGKFVESKKIVIIR